MPRPRTLALLALGGIALLLVIALTHFGQAQAAHSNGVERPQLQETPPPEQKSISNQVCLDCHGEPGLTLEM